MARVKTAVSLDKSLYEQIGILARQMQVSRSRLFAMALEDFLRRHENERLFQEINRAYQDERDRSRATLRQGMQRLHRIIVDGEW